MYRDGSCVDDTRCVAPCLSYRESSKVKFLDAHLSIKQTATRLKTTQKNVMRLAISGELNVSFLYMRRRKMPQCVKIGSKSLEKLGSTKTLWLED